MSSIQQLIQIYGQTNDKKFLHQIISQINTNETIWVAYSPVTKNHYIDYIKGAPTAFIFSEEGFCEDFKVFLAKSGVKIETMECSAGDRTALFSDMYRSGIELIVVDNGKTLLYVDLSDIAEKPDHFDLPPEQQPVSNPKLLRSADYFFELFDSKGDSRSMEPIMLKEIYESQYLLPVLTDEAAKNGKSLFEVKTEEGQMLNIPALTMKDGRHCIPVFTDWTELKRFDKNQLCSGNIILFDNIADFCQDGASVVINPFGFNMVIDQSAIAAIRKAANIGNDDITVFNIETISNEMAAALIEQLEKSGAAKSAYLRGIRQNGVSGYLLIIDINEGGEEKIAALPQAILPLTEGVPITLVKYKSEFGRQAAQGQEPFYQKVIIES